MVEIPDSLVERLKRRQTALVSGLGVGELAGAPGWAALVEWLASRLPTEGDRTAALKLVGSGRIADAVALVRAALGPGALPAAIREAYPDGSPIPDTIGQAASLPWRAVVTTGFDDLWERALTANSEKDARRPPHVLVGTDTAAGALRNGQGDTANRGRGRREGAARDLERDPFDRPAGAFGAIDGRDTRVPDRSVLDRARQVLEELRRRAAQPSRPRLELDYLDRLMDQF